MTGEVISLDQCRNCGGTIEASAKFCAHCGKRVKRPSPTADGEQNLRDAAKDFARGTVAEARNLGAEALRSDVGKKVAAGAALGAVAGAVVPLIGPAIGATLGAGYVAFKRLTK